ncbi:uncharacterized protein EI90DRAFT_3080792 [Cantharellus anzutake]|uniref:uncharacterized protein n=1 Tax=Cantharellus anzutake TaxID=1750568 RepID=UPI001905639D|nr:uncharacterized protein EI90DRAFT_3080792 [Cantharellus anzutake]KAF8320620.1 hypothetical protein EI90DRAFT_3080792 [Cantharellus anzutake]
MMSVQARLRNWHCIAIYTGAFNNILTPSLTVHKLLQLKSEIASTSTSSSDATRDTTSVIPTGTDLQMQEARRETEKDLNGAILIVISYSALFVIILSLGSFFIIVMPEKAIWYMSLLAQLTGVLPVLLMINSCYKKKRTQGSA